ncbi:hypothetical protein EAH57_15635 [Acinetobacter sp. 2JN-4]|uniref:hypothetical protein n=1 Tax=Acinetobacter sp. 2JN-4 TaxID=2479844 RepID=UPI000EF99DAA|nr:hypothetical protein [Acinetobacter sp. 2JN-4]RLZ06571.1 hypothetical protein EAH57_15635 [Acinetobacter sp. 2JN-4]
MKLSRLLLIILNLLLVTGSIYADDMDRKNCLALAKFGESAMKARQRGISIIDMHKAVEKEPEPVKKIMESIINEAFDFPIYKNLEYADVVASEYSNQFYKICISKE